MNDRDALVSIGRVAEMTALTILALRFYDRRGVLVSTAVDYASGCRSDAEAQAQSPAN